MPCHFPFAKQVRTLRKYFSGESALRHLCLCPLQKSQAATIFRIEASPPSERSFRCSAVAW